MRFYFLNSQKADTMCRPQVIFSLRKPDYAGWGVWCWESVVCVQVVIAAEASLVFFSVPNENDFTGVCKYTFIRILFIHKTNNPIYIEHCLILLLNPFGWTCRNIFTVGIRVCPKVTKLHPFGDINTGSPEVLVTDNQTGAHASASTEEVIITNHNWFSVDRRKDSFHRNEWPNLVPASHLNTARDWAVTIQEIVVADRRTKVYSCPHHKGIAWTEVCTVAGKRSWCKAVGARIIEHKPRRKLVVRFVVVLWNTTDRHPDCREPCENFRQRSPLFWIKCIQSAGWEELHHKIGFFKVRRRSIGFHDTDDSVVTLLLFQFHGFLDEASRTRVIGFDEDLMQSFKINPVHIDDSIAFGIFKTLLHDAKKVLNGCIVGIGMRERFHIPNSWAFFNAKTNGKDLRSHNRNLFVLVSVWVFAKTPTSRSL